MQFEIHGLLHLRGGECFLSDEPDSLTPDQVSAIPKHPELLKSEWRLLEII